MGIEVKQTEKAPTVYGLAVTELRIDSCTQAKNLWIYAIYSHLGFPSDLVAVGYETLKAFGRQSGCKSIMAVTNVQAIMETVQRLGGSIDATLVRMEI